MFVMTSMKFIKWWPCPPYFENILLFCFTEMLIPGAFCELNVFFRNQTDTEQQMQQKHDRVLGQKWRWRLQERISPVDDSVCRRIFPWFLDKWGNGWSGGVLGSPYWEILMTGRTKSSGKKQKVSSAVQIWTLFFAFPFFFRPFFLGFLLGSTISPLKEVDFFSDFCWLPKTFLEDLKRPGLLSCHERLFFAGFLAVSLPPVWFFCFSFFTDLFTRMERPSSLEAFSSSASCTESALCNRETQSQLKLQEVSSCHWLTGCCTRHIHDGEEEKKKTLFQTASFCCFYLHSNKFSFWSPCGGEQIYVIVWRNYKSNILDFLGNRAHVIFFPSAWSKV